MTYCFRALHPLNASFASLFAPLPGFVQLFGSPRRVCFHIEALGWNGSFVSLWLIRKKNICRTRLTDKPPDVLITDLFSLFRCGEAASQGGGSNACVP